MNNKKVNQINDLALKLLMIKLFSNVDIQKLLLAFSGNLNISDCHQGVRCDGCKAQNFVGTRFKCFYCSDFDLCLSCFKKGKQILNHKIQHPMIAFRVKITSQQSKMVTEGIQNKQKLFQSLLDNKIYHQGSQCSICGVSPIIGYKIKCQECSQYQMCYPCFKNTKVTEKHTKKHRSIILISPIRQFKSSEIQIIQQKNDKGYFGSVVKAKIKKNNKIVALKKIQADKQTLAYNFSGKYSQFGKVKKQSWENQRRSYFQFFSDYIINCYGFWAQRCPQKTKLFIVLQWMDLGTLQNQVKTGSQSKRRLFQYALQVIKGLKQMHAKNFIHKDIKPDNILISKNKQAKLGDLGISMCASSGNSQLRNMVNTHYGAPQILNQKQFDEKSDIFSYGLTLNFIFTGVQHKRIAKKVVIQKKSPYFYELICKCLDQNPSMRYSSQKIEGILQRYDDIFWENIGQKKNDYIKLSNAVKDQVFDKLYEKIWVKLWEGSK